MSVIWKTKFGPRRVRSDPPTIAEALAAAEGLTDELDQQIEIAAGLMDISEDEVRAELETLQPKAEDKSAIVAKTTRTVAVTTTTASVSAATGERAARTVIVERKTRRTAAAGRSTLVG
jgi:hypothetical protein